LITLNLPYPVSANRYWATRVVTPKGQRPMAITYVTSEANEYKQKVQMAARIAGVTSPLKDCTVKLEIWLYPQRPQDWQTRQRKQGARWHWNVRCIDLGNCEKILSDALNGICFEDDSQHFQIVKQRMEPDEHGARLVVRISQLPTGTKQESLL